MAKLPALQFYPGDWKKDVGVQSLSMHDRGVWIEILFLMHDSRRRGVLLLGDNPMPIEVLARLLSLSKESISETVETLVSFGVTEREPRTGALISRRMMRDEEKRSDERGRLSKWRKSKELKEERNVSETANETEIETEKKRLSSSSFSPSKNKSALGEDSPSEKLTPEIVAHSLGHELGMGFRATPAIVAVCRARIAKGSDPEALRGDMLGAWEDYKRSMPNLSWTYSSPEKFFAGNLWDAPKSWPWKTGKSPPRPAGAPKQKFIPAEEL